MDRDTMRAARAFAAIALGASLVVVPPTGSAAQPDDLCSRFGSPAVAGAIAEREIVELSGLAGSREHPGVLWGHNDSGGALYAFAEDGSSLGAYPVRGAEAVDWEDMAAGPTPDGSEVLYVGDIGDNGALRSSVTVHRLSEPAAAPVAPGVPVEQAEAIELRYPGGPADAEALLIDPRTGDLVIVTKSLIGASRIFTAEDADLVPGDPVELTDAGGLQVPIPDDAGLGLPATAVTGGDVSPDGSIVLLRTYQSVLAFERNDDESVAEALLGQPCFAPQTDEPQGEAIAFTGDGSAYVTASEGAGVPIHRVEITAPATTTTAPASSPIVAEDGDGETADNPRPLMFAVIGAALIIGGVLAMRAARRSAG